MYVETSRCVVSSALWCAWFYRHAKRLDLSNSVRLDLAGDGSDHCVYMLVAARVEKLAATSPDTGFTNLRQVLFYYALVPGTRLGSRRVLRFFWNGVSVGGYSGGCFCSDFVTGKLCIT